MCIVKHHEHGTKVKVTISVLELRVGILLRPVCLFRHLSANLNIACNVGSVQVTVSITGVHFLWIKHLHALTLTL